MSLMSGSSEQRLIALINEVNVLPTPLKEGSLYYGKVHPKTDGSGKIRLPTVTMFDAEYEGYVTFEYRRIDLSAAWGGLKPTLHALGQPTLHRLLPTLNKLLGLNLTPRDVADVNISWLNGNEQANIQIIAAPNSLGYEGSFIVQFTRVRPLLNDVVKQKALETLQHPDGNDITKRSLALGTWGLDFTEYTPIMIYYWTGWGWGVMPQIRQMFADLGFAGIPDAQGEYPIIGYTTKQRPESNQAFNNVLIWKDVVGPDYQGDAYMHFNPK